MPKPPASTPPVGLLSFALAQQVEWGQCGGQGWTGPTTCVSGTCCTFTNDFYSQCVPGTCAVSTTTISTTTAPASTPTGTFNNPVLWEDLADNDVFRVNNTYYYTASTMHYSPGAPILQSFDLVNWEYIGHAVPSLSWSSKYNLLNGQRAYIEGIYASTMRFRQSNGLWYWIGCIEFSTTHIYTAHSVTGPWTLSSTLAGTCFYDCSLLIDDDDTMYVSYGGTKLNVAKLSSDGLSMVSTAQVFDGTSIGAIEGSRFYKVNGKYIISTDLPASAQYILQSSTPQGKYTSRVLISGMTPPVSSAGNPHQGSLVETAAGHWYYMAFIDSYPGGRVPVLAPITWGTDGFPTLTSVGGAWGKSYPAPAALTPLPPTTNTDTFSGTALGAAWEWNHNPDTTKFSVNNGLTLSTATVTVDLYQARNTLTKRIHGPKGVGTAVIDFTNMAAGDRTGLVLLRDQSAWVGVMRNNNTYLLAMVNGINMNADWTTATTGTIAFSTPITVKKVWLRLSADIAPGDPHTATFSYSSDGTTFTTVGPTFTMENNWMFFMGYRYGIFNYATTALGGSVHVTSFTSA
ncbi:glycosyl hydrolase [Mycena albidolilacea]|uniref:Glycosyl hydrolase n=1 Tax=Mycena albidolilacea TaxID=1033008 RepID=A0AAD6Z091_9AGAR|nr:glycosyl hydrolase [Mycena albidolilacea]